MPLIRRATDPSPPATPPEPAEVLAALAGGTGEARWAAARAAADLPGGAQALGRALGQERDRRVREAILTSLARLRTAESALAVLPHLRSDDADLRNGALDALRAMPDATAPHLRNLLRDDDPDVRLLACELARHQPADAATEQLCALLEDEREANVCAAAVEALAEVGTAVALPALARCAERFRDNEFLRFAVKVAAARIGPPPAAGG
jgi:HEAT repeat protein